ncbi:unnamed protein product [Arctogadus glacialis]
MAGRAWGMEDEVTRPLASPDSLLCVGRPAPSGAFTHLSLPPPLSLSLSLPLSLPPPLPLSLPPPLSLSLSLSLSLPLPPSLPPSGALCVFLREKDGHLAVMAFSFPQLSHTNSNTHIRTHSLVLPVARCPSARHLFQNAPSSQPSALSALPCVHLSLLSLNHQRETQVSLNLY